MQVKTSSTSRWCGCAWQTPLVASNGKFSLPRDFDGGLIARFFFAAEMALQFDVNIFPAERSAELPHAFHGHLDSALRQSVRQRAFVSTGQADQAAGISATSLRGERSLRLFARAVSCA